MPYNPKIESIHKFHCVAKETHYSLDNKSILDKGT